MRHDNSAIATEVGALPPIRKNQGFRLFWFGETVSLFGTQVTALALPLVAIEALGASDTQVGLLRFLQLVPYLLLALLVGVWVDRVRKRPVLMGSNAARLLLLMLIPVLYWLGALDFTTLALAALAIGVASVCFDVTWMAYVPILVPDRRHYVQASSRLSMSSSAADIAGPGLGGALLSLVAAPVVLLVDALTYLVSLVALTMIRSTEPTPARADRRSVLTELREGGQFVLSDPVLRALALIGACCNFAMVSVWTMFLIYGARDVALAPSALGGVLAIASVGGLLGAALAGRLLQARRLGTVYAVAQTTLLLGPWLIVLSSPENTLVVAAMSAASFFLTYFGLGVAGVIIVSLRQASTPRALMARMTATFRTLLFGGGALGGLAAGILAEHLGARMAITVVAALSTAVAWAVWRSPVRRVSALPQAVE